MSTTTAQAPSSPPAAGRLARGARIAGMQGLGSLTGFLREMALARAFGTQPVLDAFLLLFLPIDLLITFARDLYTVILPRLPQDDAGAAASLAALARRAMPFAMLAAMLYLGFGACAWALGFTGRAFVPADLVVAAVLAPAIPLLVLHGMACTHFVRRGSFSLVTLGPAVINAGAIACVLGGAAWAGIISAAVGVTLGVVALVVVECVRLAGLAGDGSLAWWRRRHEAAVQPSRVAAPLCMMAGENLFSRGGVLLERAFGAALEAGAISVLSYSTRLISLPFNVLVPVVSFPIFPRFVSAIAAGDRRRCARLLAQGIATSLLLTAGALAVLLVWRREIIALAFQRGEFTAADTELVSQTLVWHAIGGAGWAVRNICERLLWAAKRNAWSLASGAAAFVLQLGLAAALAWCMGRNGLALSTSLAQCGVAGIMLALCIIQIRRV